MIEIRDDDKFVIALRDFYARKGRIPHHTEMNPRFKMPYWSVLHRHFGGASTAEVYKAVLGVPTAADVIEQYVIKRSMGGTKRIFYTNTFNIGQDMDYPARKIGAYMRNLTKPGASVAGYAFTVATGRGNGYRRQYAVTRIDSAEPDPERDFRTDHTDSRA